MGSSRWLEVTDQRIAGRPTTALGAAFSEAGTFTSEDVIGRSSTSILP